MSNRKVIDIFPPKKPVVNFQEDRLKELERKEEVVYRKKTGAGKWLIFSLLLLISLGSFCYFTLSKAEINLWPNTEELSLEKDLTVSQGVDRTNASLGTIPAQTFQREKEVTATFQSSGTALKEEKARGVLRVYNDYSTSPQVLIATPRFVTPTDDGEGKVFRTPVAVTIPGGTYEGGKLIPGEIDVEVVADQSGPEYNIDASVFSIPGFAGTDKYTKFYGRSFEPMTGGLREERAVVTKEDFDGAKDSLLKQAKEECEKLLAGELQSEEVSSKFYYFPNESLSEITKEFPMAAIGEETEEFKFQVKASCQTLIFRKEDLWNFTKDSLLSLASQGYELYEESLKVNYSPQAINLESGEVAILLNASVKAYSGINVSNFKDALAGKSLLEAKLFLEGQPNITKVSVRFWPFWVGKVPEDLDRIEININIDS
ncbi:MAG: hypothetical protein Q8P74_00125 [bacterium]|nr:hypothetical protein [bacterium]